MTAQERLKIIEALGYTITPEMIAHEEEIDNDSAIRKLTEVKSTYGANWEQDADSLREVLQNGDAIVFNQSGVEQADEAERKISAGTQRLIDAGCLDKNGNLIPYKSIGRRETPLSAEDVTDYYGEDGYEF